MYDNTIVPQVAQAKRPLDISGSNSDSALSTTLARALINANIAEPVQTKNINTFGINTRFLNNVLEYHTVCLAFFPIETDNIKPINLTGAMTNSRSPTESAKPPC